MSLQKVTYITEHSIRLSGSPSMMLKNRLVKKDAAMVTLEKNHERKLLEGLIDGLRKELINEKRLLWEVIAVMLADTVEGYIKEEKRLISDFKRLCGSQCVHHALSGMDNDIVH
ncbi:hypothetical protein FRX31_008579 [Thalictrum thalictroides]|uniref:Uncharacterized protein n=1 Tax=Thalictrum thalictroides TaxID=46969 RepID=A0A7J6WWM7_THATH|nr:hypothetical protein FRX31_008579 [Thalictrum thalictroides]